MIEDLTTEQIERLEKEAELRRIAALHQLGDRHLEEALEEDAS